MPFRTAVTGLNASQQDMKVISNNISNASTTGFKSSRAEFADIFPVSKFGTGATSIGAGVRLDNVRQQFTQGNVSFTNNNLDLAINGQGFYRVTDSDGSVFYSRAGQFGVDNGGFIVNNKGLNLTGFTATDGVINGTLGSLRISSEDNAPKASTNVTMSANLDATEIAKGAGDPVLAMGAAILDPAGAAFVPPRFTSPDPDSFNHSTSFTVYDTLGSQHNVTLYYRKTANNTWTTEMSLDNQAFVAPTEGTGIAFSNAGVITTPAGPPLGTLTYAAVPVGTGAADLAFTIGMGEVTQFGASFGVNALTQDGFTSGRLSGVDIDPDGLVLGRFTNGQSQILGQVALANFANPGGLRDLGDTLWAESAESGAALVGAPGTSSLGVVQSGALEDSNVDLTLELVNLIIAQRNFQANAQVISTADEIAQTIVNL